VNTHYLIRSIVQLTLLFALIEAMYARSANAANDPIRVMTYNIRYLNESDGQDVWSNRSESVIQTIRTADIVGLQEVVLAQFQAIQAGTPQMEWYGVGRDDGKEGGEMAPLGFSKERFSRVQYGTFWLSDSPETVGKPGWDAALPRTVTWMLLESKADSKQFFVFNTHFDHRGSTAREESGKLLASRVDAVAGDLPCIVMGDFNAGPDSIPMLNVMAGRIVPLHDCRKTSSEPPKGPTGTWNGFKEIDLATRIDHILSNDRVQVLTYEVLDPKTKTGRFASDHLPVVVRLSL
jgi:endonuclease/exonuclease/phosphatase family metal-dependent hydrolase